MPSHASLFTGLLPRELGLAQAPAGPASVPELLAPYAARLLPEVLRRAGWSTRGMSTNVWVSRTSGFSHGYDEWVDVAAPRRGRLFAEGRRARLGWEMDVFRARIDDGAAAARRVAHEWLRAQPSPFFWFVNLLECHSPYLPPRPWNDLGLLMRRRVAMEARAHLRLETIWQAALGVRTVPDDALNRMRHLYGRAVTALDAWIGDLLQELDRLRMLDDTLVVVTSDHGENLGESGRMGHAFTLDNRLLHVPLVTAGPGAFGGELLSLTDVPAMLARSLGLVDHPYGDPRTPEVAVAQIDGMAAPGDPRIVKVQGEWGLDDRAVRLLTEPQTAATDGRFKLLEDSWGEHLFDLRADSLERQPLDLSSLDAAAAAALPRLQRAVESARGRVPVSLAPASPPFTAPTAPDAAEVADIEERMRLLGYL